MNLSSKFIKAFTAYRASPDFSSDFSEDERKAVEAEVKDLHRRLVEKEVSEQQPGAMSSVKDFVSATPGTISEGIGELGRIASAPGVKIPVAGTNVADLEVGKLEPPPPPPVSFAREAIKEIGKPVPPPAAPVALSSPAVASRVRALNPGAKVMSPAEIGPAEAETFLKPIVSLPPTEPITLAMGKATAITAPTTPLPVPPPADIPAPSDIGATSKDILSALQNISPEVVAGTRPMRALLNRTGEKTMDTGYPYDPNASLPSKAASIVEKSLPGLAKLGMIVSPGGGLVLAGDALGSLADIQRVAAGEPSEKTLGQAAEEAAIDNAMNAVFLLGTPIASKSASAVIRALPSLAAMGMEGKKAYDVMVKVTAENPGLSWGQAVEKAMAEEELLPALVGLGVFGKHARDASIPKKPPMGQEPMTTLTPDQSRQKIAERLAFERGEEYVPPKGFEDKLLTDHENFRDSIDKLTEAGATDAQIEQAFNDRIKATPADLPEYKAALEQMKADYLGKPEPTPAAPTERPGEGMPQPGEGATRFVPEAKPAKVEPIAAEAPPVESPALAELKRNREMKRTLKEKIADFQEKTRLLREQKAKEGVQIPEGKMEPIEAAATPKLPEQPAPAPKPTTAEPPALKAKEGQDNKPILSQASLIGNSDFILAFDRAGKIPSPAEVKTWLEDNTLGIEVDVAPTQGMVSESTGTARFRVTTRKGFANTKSAPLLQEKTGGELRNPTTIERMVPMNERLDRVLGKKGAISPAPAEPPAPAAESPVVAKAKRAVGKKAKPAEPIPTVEEISAPPAKTQGPTIAEEAAAALLPKMEKQISDANTITQKAAVVSRMMDGEAPETQKALAQRVMQIAPEVAEEIGSGRRDIYRPIKNFFPEPAPVDQGAGKRPLYSVEYLAAKYAKRGMAKVATLAREMWTAGKPYASFAIEAVKRFGKTVKASLREIWGDFSKAPKPRDFQTNQYILESQQKGGFEGNLQERARLGGAEKVKEAFLRELEGLKKVQDVIKSDKKLNELPEEQDALLASEMSKGRTRYGLEALQEQQAELAKMIAEEGATLDELERFRYAQHVPERVQAVMKKNPDFPTQKGKYGAGMDPGAAALILKKAKDTGRFDALNRLSKKVSEVVELDRKLKLEYGLITKDHYDKMQNWKHYIPLKGRPDLYDMFGPDRTPIGPGFQASKGMKPFFGRITEAKDTLGHLFEQTAATIISGEKNLLGQKLMKLVKDHPDGTLWELDEPKYKYVADKETGQAVRILDKNVTDNEYLLFQDGKAHIIRFKGPTGARIAAEMKRFGQATNPLMRILQTFTGLHGQTITQMNPEFILSNPSRDIREVRTNIETDHGVAGRKEFDSNILRAFPEVHRYLKGDKTGAWAADIEEFRQLGGPTGYFERTDPETIQNNLRAAVEKAKTGKGSVDYAKDVVGWVQHMTELSELGTRVATFRTMKKLGLSPARAANYAKNASVNFDRQGSWGPAIKALYMFGNANIQGGARALSTLREVARGNKQALKTIGKIVAGAAIIDFLNSQNPEYDKLQEEEKERNTVFMVPGMEGGHLKIPLPYGFSPLYTLGRKASEIIRGKTSWGDAAADTIQSFGSAFNPTGTTKAPGLSAKLVHVLAPTLLKYPVEAFSNKQFFSGQPVSPEKGRFDKAKATSERYFPGTNRYAVAAAKFMNEMSGGNPAKDGWLSFSPNSIEHVTRALTGGVGTFIGRTANLARKAIDKIRGKDTEPLTPNEIPLARVFVGGKNNRFESQKFNENLDELESLQAQAEINRLPEGAAPKVQYLDAQKDLIRDIRKLNKDMIAAKAAGDTKSARQAQEGIFQLQKAFNDGLASIGKKAKSASEKAKKYLSGN